MEERLAAVRALSPLVAQVRREVFKVLRQHRRKAAA